MQFDDANCSYTICGYAVSAWDVGDEAISESHKYINLLSAVGSLVRFLLLRSQSTFLILLRLLVS